MPFTFSHPAIVLPLTFLPKKWFSLTGLVVGSLTPDFEYFLRMRVQSNYSHTGIGLFWFDLPIGIFIAFLFHNIVRNCLFDNLPPILNSRLSKFKQFEWNDYFKKNWLVVILSVLIGTVSHIFWDSFTHENGYFVQIIPELTNRVGFYSIQVPVFKILQHSSTLLGGLVIIFALLKLTPDQNVIGQLNIKYWRVLAMLSLTIIGVRLLTGLDFQLSGHLIVTAISAGLIALILAPSLIGYKK
jgi:hypothetical protein